MTLATGCCSWLLLFPGEIANTLSRQPLDIARVSGFLYLRGWFVAFLIVFGVYSHAGNWYLGPVFSAFLRIGSVEFAFDLFNIYAERLSQPTQKFTLTMIPGLISIGFVHLNIRNLSRIPGARDRVNALLPFRRPPGKLDLPHRSVMFPDRIRCSAVVLRLAPSRR